MAGAPRRRTFAILLAVTVAVASAWFSWPREGEEQVERAEAGRAVVASARSPRRRSPRAEEPIEPPAQPPAAPKSAPRDKDAIVATLTGRVVNAVTGEPVSRARLRWGYVSRRLRQG